MSRSAGFEAARRWTGCAMSSGRVESSWRPPPAEEGFEIVRRRLFESIPGDQFKNRHLTARGFSELYHTQAAEFPPECRSAEYEKRIQAAYPVHPEGSGQARTWPSPRRAADFW